MNRIALLATSVNPVKPPHGRPGLSFPGCPPTSSISHRPSRRPSSSPSTRATTMAGRPRTRSPSSPTWQHRRRRGRRRRVAEPPPRRSQLVRRQGQGGRAVAAKRETGFDAPHRRRRAVARPAARARGAPQGQGHRPQPADPRHLRPARPDPRGPAPGGARPARVPAAAPDKAVDAPVADRRRDRDPRVPARASSRRTGGSSGRGSRR